MFVSEEAPPRWCFFLFSLRQWGSEERARRVSGRTNEDRTNRRAEVNERSEEVNERSEEANGEARAERTATAKQKNKNKTVSCESWAVSLQAERESLRAERESLQTKGARTERGRKRPEAPERSDWTDGKAEASQFGSGKRQTLPVTAYEAPHLRTERRQPNKIKILYRSIAQARSWRRYNFRNTKNQCVSQLYKI